MPAQPTVYVTDTNMGTARDEPFTPGMTAGEMFKRLHPNADINAFTLAVNNIEVKDNATFQADDELGFTPAKVRGAA